MKRTLLAAAVAVLLAGTAQAAVTEFIIYKEPNFQGQSQTIKGTVNILEGGFANEGSSLKVLGGYWFICTETHFQGDCAVLAPGDYPRLPPQLNNNITSVRFLGIDAKVAQGKTLVRPDMVARAEPKVEPPRESRVERRDDRFGQRRDERRDPRYLREGSLELYGRPDFRGRSVRIERSIADLGEINFDGRASSVVVTEGTWLLCTQPGFEGRCRTFPPGQYEQLAGLDDRVSSVRRVR
jgi:hypothetical protein